MRFVLSISLILFSIMGSSATQASDQGMLGLEMSAAMAGEMDEMRHLLALIETQTEIATKEKMNADFVPGIITILLGEKMEAMGARTVGEAISMTPGVETSINNAGDPMILIRGIGRSHHSGHMQIQLNSVTVNKTFDGAATSAFYIPIEQVERIEIIRGPGASLHGEFAYSGVVNIVTKKGSRAYASGGAFGTSGAGLSYNYENPETGAFFSLNGSSRQSDGSRIDSGPDHFASEGRNADLSFSPGPIDDEEKHVLGVIRGGVGGLELLVQNSRRHYGQYYGMLALTPQDMDAWQEEDLNLARVSYMTELSDNLKMKLYADAAENSYEVKNHLLMPPGAPIPLPGHKPGEIDPSLPPGPESGRTLSNFYNERKTGLGVEASYNGWRQQKWLAQAHYSAVSMGDVWQEMNYDPRTGGAVDTPVRYTGEENNWLSPGKERKVVSLALQDQIEVSDSLNLTIGVRSDDFDDAGSSVSPRLAGVWRNGPHIIKAQYAQAYRPPTFAELYSPQVGPGRQGNPDLEAETSQTAELGYIYNQPGITARVTVYQANLENMILPGAEAQNDRKYHNVGKARQQGLEMEVEKEIGDEWNVMANVSFADTTKQPDGENIGDYAKILGNIAVFGNVANNVLLAVRVNHVGEQERTPDDSRQEPLQAYTLVNLSVNWLHVWTHGLTLRAGVNNVADQQYKAPSAKNTFLEDLPRPGRTWWAQVSYEF